MSTVLQRLFPLDEFKMTVMRFPLSAVCSFAMFVLMLLIIHDVVEDKDDVVGKIATLFSAGYFFFGIVKLIQESGGPRQITLWPLFLLLVALVFLNDHWFLYFWFIGPVFLLGIMVAAYLRDSDDLSFWFFNRMTWFGVAVAILASLILGGGLSAALASIDYLFNIDVEEELYGDIWAFSCLILGPIYALSWVPKKFHFTAEECNDPPGLAFLVNWVLAPLVLLYLLILYAYLAKILITQEWPRGQLSYMITGFGGVGIATYLMAWPLRDQGTPLLKLFYRIFFPALILPVAMQFAAIWQRVDQYGLTEERGMIIMTAVWFAFVSIAFALKARPLKILPLSLAIFLLGGTAMVGLSGMDQKQRLDALLAKYDIIQNGKIVKTEAVIPFQERQSISSILQYLIKTERDDFIRAAMQNPPVEKARHYAGAVTKEMGFEFVGQWETDPNIAGQKRFSFNVPHDWNYEKFYKISGFDYRVVTTVNMYDTQPWKKEWPAEDGRPAMALGFQKPGLLSVSVGNARPVNLDVAAAIAEDVRAGSLDTRQELVLTQETGGVSVEIRVINMSGEIKNGDPQINYMNFELAFSAPWLQKEYP